MYTGFPVSPPTAFCCCRPVCCQVANFSPVLQGIPVLTVMAEDKDLGHNGSVIYSLKQSPMRGRTALFSIDSESGLISTHLSDALDREKRAEYDNIIVQARDRGTPHTRSGRHPAAHRSPDQVGTLPKLYSH